MLNRFNKNYNIKIRVLKFLHNNSDQSFTVEELNTQLDGLDTDIIRGQLDTLIEDNFVSHRKVTKPRPNNDGLGSQTIKVEIFRISGHGSLMMEDRQHKRLSNILTAVGIFVAGAIAIGIAVYQTNKIEPIKTVPALLEDSISDKTNTFIDTVSKKAPIDSNQVEPLSK